MPRVFWILSIAGSLILRLRPAQSGVRLPPNAFVYARNLQLISRKQAREPER
jgi:lipid-A-disaccharide synthase-like uncharacterized protein